MKTPEKNNRAAWATLTHDSLNTSQTHKPKLNKVGFVFLNFGLLLGNILVLFNTGAFASVTLHAAGDLGVSPSHAAWMQTYYFVALALSLPISGWLSTKVGEIRLYLGGLIIMVLASLLCALTDELFWFLFGRGFQGFFGGLTIPLSQTLLMRQYPPEGKSFAIALWSMAALSPFTIGPAVGGWIGDEFGWRWLFYLNVPLPLLAAGLTWALLGEEIQIPRKIPFDGIGFSLLAGALLCLQTVLNQGQDSDWYNAPYLVWLTILGLSLLAYFVVWELSVRAPLLNLRLFLRRNFAIGTLMLSVAFMIVYGLLSVLLVRLQVVAGYSSFLAGCVLLPLLFSSKPTASVIHKLAAKFDARLLISINMLLLALYCEWTSSYDFHKRGSFFDQPLWSQVLEGFCLGGLFVPLTTLFLSGLNSKRQTQAVELGGMLRVLGGSVASPLMSVFWERRAAQHQIRLVDNFAPVDALSREVVGQLRAAGFHDSLAIAKVNAVANQHAAILGLNDTFRLAAWVFLGLAVLIWFANPTTPKKVAAKEDLRQVKLEKMIEEP